MINKTKARESILFKDPNPTELFSILDDNNEVDREKMLNLMNEISKHNMKLYDLCRVRAKQQLYEKNQNMSNICPKILKGITMTSGEYNPKENSNEKNRGKKNMSNDSNMNLSLPKK